MTAEEIIQNLKMSKHPEGGFYKETFRAENSVEIISGQLRNAGTAIYYLLKEDDKSHFHKLSSDEIWFFHLGEALNIYSLNESGELTVNILGADLQQNQESQVLIKANTWFAAQIKDKKGHSLVSCVVVPGFDFRDFVLAQKSELLQLYPYQKEIIEAFTLS